MVEFAVNNQQTLGIVLVRQKPPHSLQFSPDNSKERRVVDIFDAFVHQIDVGGPAEGMSQENKIPWAIYAAKCLDFEIEDGCVLAGYECFYGNLIDLGVPVTEGLEVGDVEKHHFCGEAEVHKYFEALWVGGALQQSVFVFVLQCFIVVIAAQGV